MDRATSFAVAPLCLQGSSDAGGAGPAPGNSPCPVPFGPRGWHGRRTRPPRPGPEPRSRPGRASRASAGRPAPGLPPARNRPPSPSCGRDPHPAPRGAARPGRRLPGVGLGPSAVCLALASARRERGRRGRSPGRGRPCGPREGFPALCPRRGDPAGPRTRLGRSARPRPAPAPPPAAPRPARPARPPRPAPLGTSRSPQPLSRARKCGVFSHLTRVSINSVPAPANPRHRRQKEAN